MGEPGERCGLAVFLFQLGEIVLPRLTLTNKQHGGFGKRPPSMDVAHLVARGAQLFTTGLFGALHQPTLRDELVPPRKPVHVVKLG